MRFTFTVGERVTIHWNDHHETYGHEMTLAEIKKDLCKPKKGEWSGKVLCFDRTMVVLGSNKWPEDGVFDSAIMAIIRKDITDVER